LGRRLLGFHVLSGFPLGECGHDSDCHGTQYCSAQTHHCLNKAVNGQSVPTDTGHADGTLDGTCTPGEAAIGCLSGVCNATNADNDSDPSNDDNHNKCGTVNGQACTQDTSCWSTLCTSGLCAPNCASDSDCETGFCDPYLTTCVPTLDNGASIPAGRGTCGTANAYGNPSAVCTSGACSANANTCIPSGGCAVNADCSTGQACQLSTFTCLLAGGGACTGNSDCTSNFCDTAGGNLCGYANGSSGCTTNTEAGDCQSNTCSSDGFCIPPGGCHVDTECSAGEYCAQSTYACTTDIAAGGALPNDGLHGTCSAGLNAACASGECNATTTTCAQDNGTACTNANQCVVNICGTNNLCGLDAGQAGCDVNTAATVCQSGACSQNGDCLTPGDCLVDGDCSASQYCDLSTQQCAALPTSGSSSGGGNTSGSGSSSGGGNTSGSGSSSGSGNATCATDSACPSGQWCNQGTCQAQLPAGQAIPSDAAHGGTCNADNAHALCVTGACNAVTATCGAVNNTSCAVAGECITNTCFSDGRCGLPANQQCTSDTQCRNGICVSGLCNAEAAAVATGRGLLSCSSAGGASRASVIEWALLVLLVIGARKKKRLVMSVALLVCFAATTAFSAERGFDLDRYTPADPGSRWLEAESLSSPGGALGPDRSSVLQSITLRLDFEWAHDPLVVRASGTNILSHVVENQLVGHLAASVSPIARLRLSLALPVQLWADGKTATDRSHDLAAPQAAGLGDIRLGATFRFYGEEEGRVRVGASGRLWIPSGSTAAYIGDGTVSGALSVTAAGDESWFAWSATLGARWRESTRFTYASTAVGPEAFATLAAGGQTADHRVLVGLEVPLASTLSAHAPFSSTEFSVEPGIGVHWRFVDGWRAHAAVNTGLTEALGSPLVRTMLAIEWAPAPAEKKWTPEPEPLVAPPPPPPPPASAPASEPASLPASIPVAELDSDGDGIPDSQDACPNDAGQNHSSARTNGCPMAFIKDGQIVLAEHIKFASGRAEIIEDEESNNLLNALMSTIQAHPEIARLRVIGYTDDRGPRAKNITISRQRAAAVVKWLTAHGIAASRLESVGKGPDDPITSNDTEDGRRENRRVEFKIL
jgi:outer membrane protein OmpA-like peptidoglycan-associated protein